MLKKDPIQTFKDLIPGYLPFTPNSDQNTAIEKITEFIFNKDERSVFILRGYAGTGKTNLISAVTKALPTIRWRSVLLAPTGRAAKVLSGYSQRPAQTIHKKIFRKQMGENGSVHFSLSENLHRNTLFIVDEASMISADSGESLFNSLLENLFEYVYSGDNCKLILIGDTAQLPPVGSDESPALNRDYLKSAFHLNIHLFELKEVARQRLESGILLNATNLRDEISNDVIDFPKLTCTNDFVNLSGDELEDTLNSCISRYGEDNVVIITRSNKRANLFNQSFRNRIKLYEEDLCTGDKMMVVKNNYFWLPENNGEAGFIANGDMLEITRIINREEIYGFHFCECAVKFVDYPNLPEQQVKMVTDSLFTDNPALSADDQKKLHDAILEDVRDEPIKAIMVNYLRKSPYYNALQVKFSYAITCHKSQGGQWPVVFIDQGFLKEENVDTSFLRWLYTAITRATEKIFLINFNAKFFT
jgi:exodeoxyribonuclease-5